MNFSSNMAQRIEFFCLVSVKELVFSSMTHWKLLKELFFHVSELNFFLIWVKEFNSFFKYDAKNWTLFSLNTTQRIESFVFEYDAKNWILFFFEHDAKNWKLCLKRTRRIEPSRKIAQRLETFFELDSKNRTLFFECDSKNWNFLSEK